MLFDPRLFNAIWVAIACTAITVGLAIVAVLVCIAIVGGVVHLATGVNLAVCLLLAPRFLRESRVEAARHRYDVAGQGFANLVV